MPPVTASQRRLDGGIDLVYNSRGRRYLASIAGCEVIRIAELTIADHILDKIERRHGVKFEEVEAACFSDERHIRRGREDSYLVFSRTAAGRYLLVVLVDAGDGLWIVVTARDMDTSERALYQRAKGRR